VAVLLLLLLVNVSVYSPALNRFFAGDQLYYLSELNNDRSLSGGLSCWDYTATRRLAKGDELLFRPGLYALLGVENALFGYNSRPWNMVNLALHLAISFVLFELLWALRPSVFAAAFALVFSVLTADVELVVWNHLGGYLLGLVFFMIALLAVWRLTGGDETSERRWLVVYAAAMTGAMHCYELPVVAALLIPGYFWIRGRRSGADWIALLLPLGLYGLGYAIHVSHCERWGWLAEGPGSGRSSYFIRVPQSLGFWALKALDPGYSAFAPRAFSRFSWSADSRLLAPHMIAAGALLAAGLAALRSGFTRAHLAGRGPFLGLLALLLLAYSAINNLGRSRSLEVTYYLYFFSLIGTALAYSLVDFARVGPRSRVAALAVLLMFGGWNAQRSSSVCRDLALLSAPVVDYFAKVDEFVSLHRNEEGFAFAVRGAGSLDPFYDVWMGYTDPKPGAKPTGYARVSTLLYPRYADPRIMNLGPDPARHKYLLEWNAGDHR